MSRPIKLTENLKKRLMDDFADKLNSMKMFDGKVEYAKSFKWEGNDHKATVKVSYLASCKMNELVQSFESEVGWHGVAVRDEKEPHTFHIMDILVYPQTVTGATVNTDQDAYQKWLYAYDDDIFEHIRMHGHSHVRMGVTPSLVDEEHQEKLLAQIGDNDFYIFMILNKNGACFAKVFDMRDNTLYENNDVDIVVDDNGMGLEAFMDNARKLVKKQTTVYNSTVKTTTSTPAGTTKTAVKTKPKTAVPPVGRSYDDYFSGKWSAGAYYNGLY